jgi:hypothetical protein
LQLERAPRRDGVRDFEAGISKAVLEVPHERGGVEVGDGGNPHRALSYEQ